MKETRPKSKRHHPMTRSFQLRQGLKSLQPASSHQVIGPAGIWTHYLAPARQTGALPTELTKRRLWLETEKKTFLFVFVIFWIKMNLRPPRLLRWIVSLVPYVLFLGVSLLGLILNKRTVRSNSFVIYKTTSILCSRLGVSCENVVKQTMRLITYNTPASHEIIYPV